MTGRFNHEASLRERQVAVSILAHAARRDGVAVTASLDAIADPTEELRPTAVIAALVAEFQKGMNEINPEELARWFAGEAHALAVLDSSMER
ncbi:hypothetical protein [Skermania piniformis]|uniref:Uncharacterized protein n=1 Tax=Skermania pinensis TaxID=39122 RepID=A0ABX8S5C5_9ACTN|nr:hypothetical protein [Skermania piniformis]QXQ12342.1 hypothetical protein KV203_10035 [Skermania piniformis]